MADESLAPPSIQMDRRVLNNYYDSSLRRSILLYKNMIQCYNLTNACSVESALSKSNKILTEKISGTWSIYKQLVPVLRPKILSCEEVVVDTKGTLDIKAKMREMRKLEDEIQNFIDNETPMDRIKRAYIYDPMLGRPSVHLTTLQKSAKVFFVVMFFGGCFYAIKGAKEEYMQKSKTVMFASKGAAYKKRLNFVVQNMLKNGIKLSFKSGIFLTSIVTSTQLIELYLNKTTPYALAITGGVCCGLARFPLGPKGMAAAFTIGTVAGLLCGCLQYFSARKLDETQEKLNYEEVKELLAQRRRFKVRQNADVQYDEEVDNID